jgi:hypothetical protein
MSSKTKWNAFELASIVRFQGQLLVVATLVAGCSTTTPPLPAAPVPIKPASLSEIPAPDAVLELIQRVMEAAKTGILADEKKALSALGLTLEPSTKPGSTRQIITGIAALDDDKEVRVFYGVNRDPTRSQTWGFSVRSIDQLFCIDSRLVEAKLGTPHGTVFPRHDEKNGGWNTYFVYPETGRIEASFTYRSVSDFKRCLANFSIRPAQQ